MHAPWVENRPTQGHRAVDRRELWQYRELVRFLAGRDLKVRYKQAALGVGWAVVRPLVGAVTLTVVFNRVVNLASDDLPYLPFALVGYSAWAYVSASLGGAAASLVANSALITKVYFPRLLAPAGAVLPGLVDLAVSLAVVAVLMVIFDVAPSVSLLLLPAWLAAVVLVAFGAGLWLSALNVLYRDVRSVVPFLLQVWLFASPVVFPSSLIEAPEEYFFAVNPLVGVLDGFRWSLLDAPPPGAEDLVSLASAALLLISGLAYFRHAERRFADQI